MRDDDDFAAYVVANGPRLLRIAYLLTADREQAQDAVQNVLGKALPSWRRIAADNPDAYLRRALVNERISRWRRVGRREVLTGELPETGVPDTAGVVDSRSELLDVLRRLPAKQRAAVVLRYLEDLPDAEIALALQCSEATVRSQIARALTKLRGLLDETDQNGDAERIGQ